MIKGLNKNAFSLIEYAVLFVIVMSGFLIMIHYIQRGIYGNWGKSGQSYAYGRQYDPQRTIECSFDEQSNLWYDRNCFESFSKQSTLSSEQIITGTCSQETYCNRIANSETN